jgi:hypothetical protein
LESILDDLKRYVDLVDLPDVIGLIKNRELSKEVDENSSSKSTSSTTTSVGTMTTATTTSSVDEKLPATAATSTSSNPAESVITSNLTQIPGEQNEKKKKFFAVVTDM